MSEYDIIFYGIYVAVCCQRTHLNLDDFENIRNYIIIMIKLKIWLTSIVYD